MVRNSLDLTDYTVSIHHEVHLASKTPDQFLETIHVKVLHSIYDPDEHGDELVVTQAGYVRLYYVDWERSDVEDWGITEFDVFDDRSALLSEMYLAIYRDRHANVRRSIGRPTYRSILIVDELRIASDYRGRGLGTCVMDRVLDILGRRAGIVAVKPFPIEYVRTSGEGNLRDDPAYIKELRSVERFYRRLGFRRVPKSRVMYLRTL